MKIILDRLYSDAARCAAQNVSRFPQAYLHILLILPQAVLCPQSPSYKICTNDGLFLNKKIKFYCRFGYSSFSKIRRTPFHDITGHAYIRLNFFPFSQKPNHMIDRRLAQNRQLAVNRRQLRLTADRKNRIAISYKDQRI